MYLSDATLDLPTWFEEGEEEEINMYRIQTVQCSESPYNTVYTIPVNIICGTASIL